MTAVLEPPTTTSDTGDEPVVTTGTPPGDLALHARGVTVRFGGLTAVDRVDLDIARDEVVGLIGGNGAGKTTFMNVVSGYVEPDGDATLTAFGTDLLGLPPEYRPYAEVGRSYQAATLFPGLSVTETLLVAVERHQPTPLLGAILGTGRARRVEAAKRERVAELVEACGLQAYADRLVRELSTGTRRVVDLACILAQRPGLLLLDEPTGGLAQRETEAFAPLIKRVQRELGCAVMVIEHDMVMIGQLCDRVYAMETGRVIAQGTPEQVRRDPLVIASYLGTDEVAIARSGAEAPAADPATGPAGAPGAVEGPPAIEPTEVRPGPPTPAPRRQLRAEPDPTSMTRADLLAEARGAAIPGRSRMTKAELAAAVTAHRVESARRSRGGRP